MIYVLPGMGADHRMSPPPWRRIPGSVFLDWPRGVQADSITGVAARVAQDASISDGAILVGSSLGGIVACEIAKIRRLERLFLVGSARRKEEVSSLLRFLHPLIDLTPITFVQRACSKLPSEVCSMFSSSEPAFIRGMCRAIFHWEGLPDGWVDVRRIHGRHDHVIPPPSDGEILLDGGHLIAMSHAEECVRAIEEATSGAKDRAEMNAAGEQDARPNAPEPPPRSGTPPQA